MQPENVNLCYGQEEKMSERMGAALPFHALGGKYKNVWDVHFALKALLAGVSALVPWVDTPLLWNAAMGSFAKEKLLFCILFWSIAFPMTLVSL